MIAIVAIVITVTNNFEFIVLYEYKFVCVVISETDCGMTVYCICLPERRNNCDRFFEALGVVPIYIDVTMAAEITYIPKFAEGWKGPMAWSLASMACTMSHRTACQALLNTDEPFAAVFEDDNVTPDCFAAKRYHMILAELKTKVNDFNLINLSPCNSIFPPKRSKLNLNTVLDTHLYNCSGYCLNAYVVSRSGARCILDLKLAGSLDTYIRTPKIPRTFDVHPRLFKQNQEPSTAGNTRSPPEYSYARFITLCTAAVVPSIGMILIIIMYHKGGRNRWKTSDI